MNSTNLGMFVMRPEMQELSNLISMHVTPGPRSTKQNTVEFLTPAGQVVSSQGRVLKRLNDPGGGSQTHHHLHRKLMG